MYSLAIKAWKQGETKDLLNQFFPKFIYSSNKIRGEQISFIEVENAFKYYIINNQFPIHNRLTVSIKNHIKVCKNIFEIIEENKSKLSVDLIKYLYKELIEDCFSEDLLEETGVLTLNNRGIGSLKWEQKLLVLINEINQAEINVDNVLSVVSYLCCKFESIIPFDYDNGVIVRILANYLLIGNHLSPIVFWYDDMEAYNKALRHFHSSNEICKMSEFLEDEVYKTYFKDYNVKVKKLKEFLQ